VKLMEKIFGLGLSKTGTTTLGACFAQLGFRHLLWRADLVEAWCNGDLDPIYDKIERYDTFEDLPFPFIYKELADRYPDARFILTVRSTPEKWLESFTKHAMRIDRDSKLRKRIYGVGYPQNSPERYQAFYERHNREVLAHLGDRVKQLCWESGDGWSELCGFIGATPPQGPLPWENSATRPDPFLYLRHQFAALVERASINSPIRVRAR